MLTNRALWIIERNLDRQITLSEIADICGVSKTHLAHAFGASTGISVMRYLRGRRLSAAAQALADGAPNILTLALEIGYSSHEAFSRAFHLQFGCTPEMVRQTANTEGLTMVKALKPSEGSGIKLENPRFVAGPPMLAVGLAERHSLDTAHNIAAQWQRFMAVYGDIPDKVNPIPVGVTTNMDEDGNFEYVCAVEVSKFPAGLSGLAQIRIPAQNYAVFLHSEHIARIVETYRVILNEWLPANHCVAADGPSLERHLETFDPRTGFGGVEIWIPLAAAPSSETF